LSTIFLDFLTKTVFDLWANLPTGILHGNRYSPGHFGECVNFKHDEIQGQHCMIRMATNVSEENAEVEVVLGICVPAACSPRKVVEFWNNQDEKLLGSEANCRTNDPIPFKAVEISTL
jgi:hypothetical protein